MSQQKFKFFNPLNLNSETDNSKLQITDHKINLCDIILKHPPTKALFFQLTNSQKSHFNFRLFYFRTWAKFEFSPTNFLAWQFELNFCNTLSTSERESSDEKRRTQHSSKIFRMFDFSLSTGKFRHQKPRKVLVGKKDW